MSQAAAVMFWTAAILAVILLGGLYFWAKRPTQKKPTIFEIADETEAEILTEVEDRAKQRIRQREDG